MTRPERPEPGPGTKNAADVTVRPRRRRRQRRRRLTVQVNDPGRWCVDCHAPIPDVRPRIHYGNQPVCPRCCVCRNWGDVDQVLVAVDTAEFTGDALVLLAMTSLAWVQDQLDHRRPWTS